LLAVAAVAGLLLAHRPGPNRVDATGFFYLPADPGSILAKELVKLGSLPVLVIGVAMVFMVAVFRDRARAVACAVAPIVAVLVVEHVAKPMVGRQIGPGLFTYPSGTVTVTAAIAAAVFLVTPRLFRPLAAVVGVIAIVGVSAGVLVLRWHYPTDVVGGFCVGVGSVFFIDALAHVPGLVHGRRGRSAQTGSQPERQEALVSP
jgi:membrane-associated phospholipid phosphatase